MFLQTWTKIPFFVGPGEAWANDVMLDTAQIFFVDGSCNQQRGWISSKHCFFVSNTSKYNTFSIKLKYQAINTWWITALVGDGAGSKKVAAVEMLCRRSSGLSIVSEGTLQYTAFVKYDSSHLLGQVHKKLFTCTKFPDTWQCDSRPRLVKNPFSSN